MKLQRWRQSVLAVLCATVTWPAAGQEPPVGKDFVPQTKKDTIVVDPNLFPQPQVPQVILYRSAGEPADVLKARVAVVQELGTHWIGVGCSPATETLRSQLRLEPGTGLVVDHVFPDSPAAKAGLKVHDLLLKVQHGEKSIVLKDLADLSTAVGHVKTDEMQIELLRAGERQTVGVTPAERPETVSFVGTEKGENVAIAIGDAVPSPAGGGVYRLNVAGPAFAYAHVRKFGGLPEGVTVSITRTGNEPAKVTVRRADQSWETTEKDLSVLPEDLRGPVKEMLQHPPHAVPMAVPVPGMPIGIPGAPVLPQPPVPPVPPQAFRIERVVPGQPPVVQTLRKVQQEDAQHVEREMADKLERMQKLQLQEQKTQLEALNKKLEALQQAIEKLQAAPTEKPLPKE